LEASYGERSELALPLSEAVLPGNALKPWEDHFPERRDRALWDIIRVKKL
jgi:hypothetical protein